MGMRSREIICQWIFLSFYFWQISAHSFDTFNQSIDAGRRRRATNVCNNFLMEKVIMTSQLSVSTHFFLFCTLLICEQWSEGRLGRQIILWNIHQFLEPFNATENKLFFTFSSSYFLSFFLSTNFNYIKNYRLIFTKTFLLENFFMFATKTFVQT